VIAALGFFETVEITLEFWVGPRGAVDARSVSLRESPRQYARGFAAKPEPSRPNRQQCGAAEVDEATLAVERDRLARGSTR
jgi:hypothetical protein